MNDLSRIDKDPFKSFLFAIGTLVVGGLLTTAAITTVSTLEKVNILLDRPIGISQVEYEKDQKRREGDVSDLKLQVGILRGEVGELRAEIQRQGEEYRRSGKR